MFVAVGSFKLKTHQNLTNDAPHVTTDQVAYSIHDVTTADDVNVTSAVATSNWLIVSEIVTYQLEIVYHINAGYYLTAEIELNNTCKLNK